jgi:DNA-damage-inducible protein J
MNQELSEMIKTATISARVKPELKASVEKIFDELGMTSSDAITLFLKQVELQRGLPFSIKLPRYNAETVRAIEDAAEGIDLESFENADALFKDLGI